MNSVDKKKSKRISGHLKFETIEENGKTLNASSLRYPNLFRIKTSSTICDYSIPRQNDNNDNGTLSMSLSYGIAWH